MNEIRTNTLQNKTSNQIIIETNIQILVNIYSLEMKQTKTSNWTDTKNHV